jgi:hypothetical protein
VDGDAPRDGRAAHSSVGCPGARAAARAGGGLRSGRRWGRGRARLSGPGRLGGGARLGAGRILDARPLAHERRDLFQVRAHAVAHRADDLRRLVDLRLGARELLADAADVVERRDGALGGVGDRGRVDAVGLAAGHEHPGPASE